MCAPLLAFFRRILVLSQDPWHTGYRRRGIHDVHTSPATNSTIINSRKPTTPIRRPSFVSTARRNPSSQRQTPRERLQSANVCSCHQANGERGCQLWCEEIEAGIVVPRGRPIPHAIKRHSRAAQHPVGGSCFV